jgi:hypothetical protein
VTVRSNSGSILSNKVGIIPLSVGKIWSEITGIISAFSANNMMTKKGGGWFPGIRAFSLPERAPERFTRCHHPDGKIGVDCDMP